ncbi:MULTISPECIES: CoxG family protein [Metallosphaera]|uniref:CoxG family protein n=1 Tax=Metallosphaera TaxID=41980 RepID=UPI001F05CB37|nr:SRPBCC domain-containing protein [Metallosphaera sedula]MCH1770463.1 carbon monoxide dehydrogenase [Metallosphaera sedula]
MELRSDLRIKAERGRVEELLSSPSRFAECLPGIQEYEVKGDEFRAVFKLDVSDLTPHISSLTVVANSRLAREGQRILVSGTGRSAGVNIKFAINIEIVDDREGTRILWDANLNLGILEKLLGNSVGRIAEVNVKKIVECISRKV